MKNNSNLHRNAFKSAASKDFKSFANIAHKSLSSCIRTVKEALTLNTFASEADEAVIKDFRKILRKEKISVSDINPAWIVSRLDGTDYCQGGILGYTTKEGEFVAREQWTPGRVIDYVRRANAKSWKDYNATIREARKSSLNK